MPAGYSIRVKPDGSFTDYVVELVFEHEHVGTVRVVEATARCGGYAVKVHETHSNLDKEHRGKGLGLVMYSAAISHGLSKGYTVVSSRSPSALAQRVWCSKRLTETYLVSKFDKRWWVSRARKSRNANVVEQQSRCAQNAVAERS